MSPRNRTTSVARSLEGYLGQGVAALTAQGRTARLFRTSADEMDQLAKAGACPDGRAKKKRR